MLRDRQRWASLAAPFSAVVCDVGHVVVGTSLMNHLLEHAGLSGEARVLYDMKVLRGADVHQIESWVEEVSKGKSAALRGQSLSDLQRACAGVPLTPGFVTLLERAAELHVPVMLMSAVPRPFVEALLAHAGTSVAQIAATELDVAADGAVSAATVVCTPLRKRAAVERWFSSAGIDSTRAAVIGDSVGDLPTMALVPKENRVGFNASVPEVLDYVGSRFSNDMAPLVSWLFDCASSDGSGLSSNGD